MRSLIDFLKGRTASETASGTGRPEALRRATLATNSLIITASSGALLPFALYALIHGMLLPFVLVMAGLLAGLSTIALHHRGRFEDAATGQLHGIMAIGL